MLEEAKKKVRKGTKVKLKDGSEVHVAGCYMSTEGIVLTCKQAPSDLVCRNVPIEDVQETLVW